MLTVQLDTRPSGTDISSPMSEPIGRGSGPTANHPRGVAMQTVQPGARRVRHDVADAFRLAAFSLAASAGVALLLSLCVHLAGAA